MSIIEGKIQLTPDGGGGYVVTVIGPHDKLWFTFNVSPKTLETNPRSIVLYEHFRRRVLRGEKDGHIGSDAGGAPAN